MGVGFLGVDLGDLVKGGESFVEFAFGGEEDAGDVEEVRLIGLEGESAADGLAGIGGLAHRDRKSTRLNSSHRCISYAVFCLKKKKNKIKTKKHIQEKKTIR